MALSDNIKIALNIEVAKTTNDIGKLNDSVEELNASLKTATKGTEQYADIQDALTSATLRQNQLLVKQAVDFANNAQGVGQLSKAMKQLKSAQELVDSSSPQFAELNDAINNTEGRVGDLNDKFKTLTGSGMERFQSSIGLVKEGIGNLDFGKFSTGIKGATKAFGGLKAALASLGIGLIIQAVSYLIENFDDLKKSSGLLGKILSFIGDLIGKVGEALSWLADKIGLIDKAQEARVELAEKGLEAEKAAQKATEERYDTEIAYAKAAGKETFEIEKKKMDAVQASLKAQIEGIKALAKLNGEWTDEQKKQLAETQSAYIKSIQEEGIATVKHIKERSDAQIKGMLEDAKNADKAREDRKKQQEKILADVKKRIADQLAEQKKVDEIELIGVEQGSQKYIDIKQKQNEAELKFMTDHQKMLELTNNDLELFKRKAAQETFDLTKQLADKEAAEKEKAAEDEKKRIEEIQANNEAIGQKAIEDLIAQQEATAQVQLDGSTAELEAQTALLETKRQIELDNEQLTADQKLAINQNYDAQIRQLEYDRAQAQLSIASDGLNALQGLSDTFFAIKAANTDKDSANAEKNAKKQFQINKALQLSGAIVDGAKAITSSLASAPLAIGVVPNPAGIASLAAAVLSTATSIAKIAATQYKSSGGGGGGGAAASPSIGGGGGGGGGAAAPSANFQAPTFYGLGQGQQGSGNKALPPIQVSVTEINSKQDSVAVSEGRGYEKI